MLYAKKRKGQEQEGRGKKKITQCKSQLTIRQLHREGRISMSEQRPVKSHLIPYILPFSLSGQVSWCDPRQLPHAALQRRYDLLNSGTWKYSSPAHWSTEATFLPGIIKLNRILMGPGRLVKTLPGPGSAVSLLLPNAVRLHIQAPAK